MKYYSSALKPLTPTLTVGVKTGEIISAQEVNHKILELVNYTTNTTKELYTTHKASLLRELVNYSGKDKAYSWGYKQGVKVNYSILPKNVKAKSRIQMLVLSKLVKETASWALNPNPDKQEPNFTSKISLSSTDKQYYTLKQVGNELVLTWKVWDEEYVFYFTIPEYVLKRNIQKWCAPDIIIKKGVPYFYFTIQEVFTPKTAHPTEYAGLDLGIVDPYYLTIANNKGKPVAHYTAENKTHKLTQKLERLRNEKQHLTKKIYAKQKLQLNTTHLETHKTNITNKITRLGDEVAKQIGSTVSKQIVKHNVATVNIENLSWVSGFKGSKTGSNKRFQHSRVQQNITHSLHKKGVYSRKINPHNTSQSCYGCKTKITHSTRSRSVWCEQCKTRLNRDFNAAMNITLKSFPVPPTYRARGRECKKVKTLAHETKNSLTTLAKPAPTRTPT